MVMQLPICYFKNKILEYDYEFPIMYQVSQWWVYHMIYLVIKEMCEL